MFPKSKSNIGTQKSESVCLIATKALRFFAFQALLIKHRQGPPFQQFVHANDIGVCGRCHGVFIQRMVQVHVWIDTGVCVGTVEVQVWITEERLGKCKNLRNTPKLSFQWRGGRESCRLRYNCYTEKNIVIVLRQILWKHDSDVPEVLMKRRQQDAQAKTVKHCSTEKRQQEAQAMAAIGTNLSHSLPGGQFPLGIIKRLLLLCIHV